MHKVTGYIMNVTGMTSMNSPNQAEIFKNQVELWGKSRAKESFAQRFAGLKTDGSSAQRFAGARTEGSGNAVKRGTALLTKEQLQMLKEKYDAENMEEKEFYDFLMDLTDMKEENYLMRFMNGINYSEYVLEMIRQGKCQVSPACGLGTVCMMYENDLRYAWKMQEILQQLKGKLSETGCAESD
ncbi:MAG: hypothetical protein K1W22_12300 [Lachnospiraceae bacterium]